MKVNNPKQADDMPPSKADISFADKLESMYKDEPVKLFHFMLICAGKMCADANSETTTVGAEMTFEGIRYRAEAVITLTKLHKIEIK
mgnify:CR=1 FL=1